MYVSNVLIFFLSLFIFERDRESMLAGEGQGETERKRIPSRLHAASTEPDMGLKLTICEMVT